MGNVSFLFLYDLMPRNYRLPCMITCYGLCMVMRAFHKGVVWIGDCIWD